MLSPLTHDDPVAIGAYHLLAQLGSGGMGTVYLARSTGGRTVALKTMHAGIASDPASRARFRLETDAARVIGGHHGATVVDADPLAETPWLATEYVLGPPLDEAVSLSGPLPESSVRALGAALAGALAQLHASDVVHRDLKPSNVMVTAYGPKIIDFGIARAAGDDRLTRTGAAAGTPAFMSPEQATGQEHTPAGDVFALAGVLVYAATGRGPFGSGQVADLLYRVRYSDPDLTDVPDPLVPILSRCLSKEPGGRPMTSELIAQLHEGQGQFADHLPDAILAEIARRASEVWQYQPHRLSAPAESQDGHFTPQSRISRRKLLSLAGGGVVGVAAAAAGAWLWHRRRTAEDGPSGGLVSDSPRPLWQADTGKRVEPPLLMAMGDLIATWRGEALVGLDAKSGEERWSAQLGLSEHQVATDGSSIYGCFAWSSDDDGKLIVHAFTPGTGAPQRRIAKFPDFGGTWFDAETFLVADGVLYMAAKTYVSPRERGKYGDWHLLALDLRTGRKLWQVKANWFRLRAPSAAMSPKSAGKRLILCQKDTMEVEGEVSAPCLTLVSVDIRNGDVQWAMDVPRQDDDDDQNDFRGQLAVDERHVYVGSGSVWALRLSDGKTAWKFGEGRNPGVDDGARRYGTPTVKDGVVYAAEGIRGLVALDAATGTLLWEEIEDLTKDDTPNLELPPVVGGKYVYTVISGGISAVDPRAHKAVWTYRTSVSLFAMHDGAKALICVDDNAMTALPSE
ncbi:PQQ-binding-like beta-propeller repeat protein [Streptomyces sp. NPDC002187]|uniref:protein kinase domain-containing protein n=1 Tax=Streptomyces sp. NPDC002187 TaxID=3364637 RepID=UPI0036AEA2D9